MIRRNICPICGSENPEGSIVCQVCKANLQNLPDDMFPAEPEPAENVMKTGPDAALIEEDGPDLDSPVPTWLYNRLQQKDTNHKADFESYADAIFGLQTPSAQKPARQKKTKKQEPVYQPSLDNLAEKPLVEPESGAENPEIKNMPDMKDFSNNRPAKKWDDPQADRLVNRRYEQAENVFQPVAQIPSLWQEDAPLTEDDSPEEATKTAAFDDEEFADSVSPTKVMEPESPQDGNVVPQVSDTDKENEAAARVTDEYKPDSGSLLSDLMNEINSTSVTPTPQEKKERENGTTFFTGNDQPETEEPELAIPDSLPQDEESLSSAAALDHILRNLGYQTEEEVRAAANAADLPSESVAPALSDPSDEIKAEEVLSDPEEQNGQPERISGNNSMDNAVPDNTDLTSGPEIKIPEKEDPPEEQDIPWDLFGSQDMPLPQSPEDQTLRTFSRSGIPSDGESTSYQQRMMSSILGKIIDAENFNAPRKKSGERTVSLMARLLWAVAALGGIFLILTTDIADRINIPALPAATESQEFYRSILDLRGDALVVLDYTPAYGAELDRASDLLITTLEKSTENVSICCLNPAAMPRVQQILNDHESVRFAGWWPAGVISIRTNIAAGNVPAQIWLITSDSGSVRNWGEQLAVSGQERYLHVMASGQMEPLLQPYLRSGMVTSAISRDRDLLHFGDRNIASDRTQKAVLYLAVLLPLAWLSGLFAKFLKSDPSYGVKKSKKSNDLQQNQEKEAVDAGRL